MQSQASETTGRCLKTASETLHALRLLASTPRGLSAETLASKIGKSKATARYLLNTLCREGFAYRDANSGSYLLASAPPWGSTWGEPGDHEDPGLPGDLSDAVAELYWRTRKRTYLAQVEGEKTVVCDSRGHQGLACIPGLSERISPGESHALAVTKALIAASPELAEVLRTESAFTPFTGKTITDPDEFDAELARVRESGYALDREEFAEGFYCIAAPVFNPAGQVAASLAISVGARRFALDGAALVNEVVDVADQASQHWREHSHGTGDPSLLLT